MRLTVILSVVPFLCVAGCEKKAADAPAPTAGEVAVHAAPAVKAPDATATAVAGPSNGHVHSVACGCSMGKTCSNMIQVKGEYVPLQSDGLGPMEFCGKKGLQAKVDGKLQDGKFVATSFKLIDAK